MTARQLPLDLRFATVRRALGLGALLGVGSFPALLDSAAIARAAALYPIAGSPSPYFVPEHWVLLYLWAPIVALSACLLFLGPGLLLTLAFARGRPFGSWLVESLATSIVVVSVVTACAQGFVGAPLRGAAFGALVAGLSVVAVMLIVTAVRRRRMPWPLAERQTQWTLLLSVVGAFAVVAGLAPKFYWEAFNGDGVHAFESARRLLVSPVPFWPHEAGPVAGFPGVTSMLFAYPSSWFIRLFGDIEASARLPFLLYLPVLFGAIVSVVELNRQEISIAARATIWLGLAVYVTTMAFSATYNPYSADIALPATQDTLLVVCFLGFIAAFVREDRTWIAVFAALTYLSLPSGLILMVMWLVAALTTLRARQWLAIRMTLLALGMCVVGGALLPRVLAVAHLPAPGGEYGLAGLLRYFAFLQFTDIRRLLYVAIPSGILPITVLLAVSKQDQIARAISLVTVLYFGFFFVQANVALHHFVPAMLLPIVVFWRTVPVNPGGRRVWTGGAAAAAGLALLLAVPDNADPHMWGRVVGSSIENTVADDDWADPQAMASSSILIHLWPEDWDAKVPDKSYGGSPLVWNYYARHDRSRVAGVNYVVQRRAMPPPPGTHLLAEDTDVALFVRDDGVWREHLAFRHVPATSRWLAVPRSTLFRSPPAPGGPFVLDVRAALELVGVNVNGLLAKLGIRR